MRRSALILILAPLVVPLLAGGCARQRARTAAGETPPGTAAVSEPRSDGERLAAADAIDPLAGDLDAVNEYVRREGLLGDVYFDFDRSELRSDARERLAKNAAFLSQNPQFLVVIEGHCDERGTNDYNLALGDRRSSSTRDYLASLGVDRARFRTVSYGEEKPFCRESDEGCWKLNRRAHFMITGRSDAG